MKGVSKLLRRIRVQCIYPAMIEISGLEILGVLGLSCSRPEAAVSARLERGFQAGNIARVSCTRAALETSRQQRPPNLSPQPNGEGQPQSVPVNPLQRAARHPPRAALLLKRLATGQRDELWGTGAAQGPWVSSLWVQTATAPRVLAAPLYSLL